MVIKQINGRRPRKAFRQTFVKFWLQNVIEGIWLREGRRDDQSMK